MNISLIGMSGAGKSATARELAKHMDAALIEVDTLIEQQTGETLAKTLERLGEEAFVTLEAAAVFALAPGTDSIISTGGSVVLSPGAMARLAQISTIVYLRVPFETIEARIGAGGGRGIVGLGRKTLHQLYDERLPLYERHAHITVSAAKETPERITRRICAELGTKRGG